MANYRLHGFYNSGNAFKVAMMLDLSGCAWEAVAVTPGGDAVHGPDWWAAANELGEVPVLECKGQYLSQSGVILHHLARETRKFGPRDAVEADEIWRWILFDNHKFTGNFSMLRYLCGIEKTGETPVTAYLRARVRRAWAVAERHLTHRDFILGSRTTIADLSMAGYQFYDEPTGIDRAAEFPALEAWTRRIAALSGWRPPAAVLPRV
jgi:glutathione S-transferase